MAGWPSRPCFLFSFASDKRSNSSSLVSIAGLMYPLLDAQSTYVICGRDLNSPVAVPRAIHRRSCTCRVRLR